MTYDHDAARSNPIDPFLRKKGDDGRWKVRLERQSPVEPNDNKKRWRIDAGRPAYLLADMPKRPSASLIRGMQRAQRCADSTGFHPPYDRTVHKASARLIQRLANVPATDNTMVSESWRSPWP